MKTLKLLVVVMLMSVLDAVPLRADHQLPPNSQLPPQLAREVLGDTSARRPLSLGWRVAPAVCHAADAVSTIGLRELNPAMKSAARSSWGFVAGKAVVGLGLGWLSNHLARDGHRGWGKVVAGGSAGVGCGFAASNVREHLK